MNHSQNDYISYKKQINIKTFTEIHSREILIKIENSNICSSEHTNLNDVICIFHLSDKRVLNKNTGDVIDKSKKKKKTRHNINHFPKNEENICSVYKQKKIV